MEKWFFEENSKTSFEIDISEKRRITQSLVAFSNHEGGSVFFGVNSKSKIVGCFPKEIIKSTNVIIQRFCVNVNLSDSLVHEFNNKMVVECRINKSIDPARIVNSDMDNGYYIRLNVENIKAGKILSSYFHLLANPRSNLLTDHHKVDSLVRLIKNNGPHSLAQLYKLSELTKSEVDNYLPLLLFNKIIKFELIDSLVLFY